MANFLTHSAKHAQTALANDGIQIQHSRLLHVLAAFLGYGTFGALSKEDDDPHLHLHLRDAEFFILNLPAGSDRATRLSEHPDQVANACIRALEDNIPVPVYRDVSTFYAQRGRDSVATVLDDQECLRGQLGSAWNPEGRILISDSFHSSETVWDARSEWLLQGHAVWLLPGQSAETGRAITVDLSYRKAGRAGLVSTTPRKKSVVALDYFIADVLVQKPDRGLTRPLVAVVFDIYTHTILAAAVGYGDTPDQVSDRAVAKVIYEISELHTDAGIREERWQKLLSRHGIPIVRSLRSRQIGGCVERMFRYLSQSLNVPGTPTHELALLTPEQFGHYLTLKISQYNLIASKPKFKGTPNH